MKKKTHGMTFLLTCLILVMAVTVLAGCVKKRKKYVIGVSQCSDDSWRKKLAEELDLATYFYDDVGMELRIANDNIRKQRAQIEELVDMDVDLLIVSPQRKDSLSDVIAKAADKGIPVVLFDRINEMKEYTAFMGVNNYHIGRMVADYVAQSLGGKGCIVEIGGEHGSSPAEERHEGFRYELAKYPDLRVVAYKEGNWKQGSGEVCMDSILKDYTGPIDCVFGANDRMTLGARTSMEKHGVADVDKTMFVGVDALPTPGGGLEMVKEGKLTASVLYPTDGGALMALAVSILRGENYEKVNDMGTSIVTSDNVNLMFLQNKELQQQDGYLRSMRHRVDYTLSELEKERIVMWCIIFVIVIISAWFAFTVRMLRSKHRLNEELNSEKETAERQRDEIEEQRDQLLDATTKHQSNEEYTADGSAMQNEFINRFYECIDNKLSDSELSVEDLGSEMCLSRVQLYRKVKAITHKTPVEIIRERRLTRADKMMTDTSLSVSEIAYRVGFASPSYFTKCYKDFFGKPPSARKEN